MIVETRDGLLSTPLSKFGKEMFDVPCWYWSICSYFYFSGNLVIFIGQYRYWKFYLPNDGYSVNIVNFIYLWMENRVGGSDGNQVQLSGETFGD